MLSLLNAMFQFVLTASDPQWTCELAHRDPGVPATYLLYCSTTIDGIEVVQVGKLVPDVPRVL